MSFGVELGLGPGHIVLDGDPATPKKGHCSPTFWPMSIVAKRLPISTAVELFLLVFDMKKEWTKCDARKIISRLATTDMGRKLGGGCSAAF